MDRLLGAGGCQLSWMRHAGIEHAVEELQLRIECRRDPRDFVGLDQADVDRRWDGEHDRLPAHVSSLMPWLVRSDGGLESDRVTAGTIEPGEPCRDLRLRAELDTPHEIALAENAHEEARRLEDRKATDPAQDHQTHGFIDRGLGRHRDDLPLHHLEGYHDWNLAKGQCGGRVTRIDDRRINLRLCGAGT